MRPLVSIIVPAFNAEKTIQNCLAALLKQTYQPIEIIVVDDGSTDQTASLVRVFEKVTYIYESNSGPATARNRGAAAAIGEFLCFTDSDCIAHEDWVEMLVKGFEGSNIGAVAGSYGIANEASCLARCVWKEILFRHHYLMPKYPKAFGSYNFSMRSDFFKEVGGFDSSYRCASGEDNDLSYKVVKMGKRICFTKDALADHYHPTKFLKYMREQFRHGYWRAKLYMQHSDMLAGDDYTFWKDIGETAGAFLIMLLMATVVFIPGLVSILGFLCVVLLGIEIFYGLIFCGFNFDGIFYASVMFIRMFARFLGIATGFFTFFLKNN